MEKNGLLKNNPISMCFTLICLRDEDEDQTKTGGDFLSDKLKELRAEGLTRGYAEEIVINFTAGSPISFGDSSPIWQALKEMTLNSDSSPSEDSITNSPEKEKSAPEPS